MIHYTCDGCSETINSARENRYVVKMEVYTAIDSSLDDIDDDRDHLEELQQILERIEDAEDDQIGGDVYENLRYDLCPKCREKLMRDPLGFQRQPSFDFSNN